ncbi:uncharacterized protein [Primulina huaijiensis]|uniref:uncharacterized protein isoform X2 n=1 Tax=Primulina huaijiensis TaxID=1492673 RepID=UPI003CC78296
MMVRGNDTLESFLNPIQVLKNVFSPLELNFRKVAKKIELCFNGVYVNGDSNGDVNSTNIELVAAQLNVKRKGGGAGTDHFVAVNGDDRGMKGKVPMKIFVGIFREKSVDNAHNNGVENHNLNVPKKGLKQRFGRVNGGKEDGNCLHLEVAWSFLMNGFIHGFPMPFKFGRTRIRTSGGDSISCESGVRVEMEPYISREINHLESEVKERKDLSIEYFVGVAFDQLSHFPKFDGAVSENVCKNIEHKTLPPTPIDKVNYFKVLISILEGKRADVNGFLGKLMFARVGGVPSGMIEMPSLFDVGDKGVSHAVNGEDKGGTSLRNLANGFLRIPLSNLERLRSTLSNVSFMELIEFLPQIGRPVKEDHPDKEKLFSVQDFFRYTEAEGKRFFQELDRDGDGQVTLEDVEVAMRKRKLPKRYAIEFMRGARNQFFSKSFGWKQFLSLMEQKEPTILRAFTSLCLSKSGMLKKSEILASLKNADLPVNEDNAVAMMRFLNDNTEESVSYGHFRNFMLLLPSDRLQEDPRIWFEAATVVSVPPPVEIPAGSVLKSALVGGLSCALSTSLLHPIDTIKTRVQASTLSLPEILSKLPQLGVRGLYRGSVPAIIDQFSSHGLRTGIFEASKLALVNVAPTLSELQVQSIASVCSTFLGTAVRIPCEVMKQRLQAGLFSNVGEAIVGTWQQDGLGGFFRGTGVTLFREVPFYVAGIGIYAESKKAAQKIIERELEPWETIAVGALSGGLAAVLTTPFDVIKTRTMTAAPGRHVTLSMVAFSILHHEGPLGLFKGAVPRFFWIAPLGAMNFAGYELAKKAMDKNTEIGEPALQR